MALPGIDGARPQVLPQPNSTSPNASSQKATQLQTPTGWNGQSGFDSKPAAGGSSATAGGNPFDPIGNFFKSVGNGVQSVVHSIGSLFGGPFGQSQPPLTSVSAADQSFVDQLGGTPYNTDGNSTGYLDCGPSSAVMALSRLGLIGKPTGDTAESAILDQRYRMHGANSQSVGTTWDQLSTGLQSRGAITRSINTDIGSLDSALAAGHPVIIGGDPNKAWGPRLDQAGNYLESSGDWGHFCTVMGKTPDGQYIVSDPLSKVGAITVSADDIKNYWNNNIFSGAMEVAKP